MKFPDNLQRWIGNFRMNRNSEACYLDEISALPNQVASVLICKVK